jgi:DNA-binding MarR family transcriptional regulator
MAIMMTPLDAHELRVVVQRLARRIRAERSIASLSDSQLSVLFQLELHGERTLGELAENERVTPPSMTRTVGALVDAGFMSKEVSTTDARKVRLTLTADGFAVIAATRRQRDAWFSQRLDELDPAERRALEGAASVMQKLADS